jgi:hypothetical protein
LSGCSDGQDGDPGPKGPDGPDGPAGNPGKDGDGFQESIAYGNIVVSFAGKLANGEDFADTVNFRYAPLGIPGFLFGSSADLSVEPYKFFIHRFYGTVDSRPGLQDNFVSLELDVIPLEDGNMVLPKQCIIHTHMPISATRLVRVQDDFTGILSVEDFEDFQYNPATGNVSFRLSFKESRQLNDVDISGLEVSLVATIKVFQQIKNEP